MMNKKEKIFVGILAGFVLVGFAIHYMNMKGMEKIKDKIVYE